MRHLLAAFAVLLSACTGVPAGVTPVSNFELERYLGTWYEIVRLDHSFERNLDSVTAEYRLLDDGSVNVLNKGFNTKEQRWREAEGVAKFVGPADQGHLKVSFFGPFYASYVVFDLDPAYRYALVSGASKRWFWILAREPQLEPGLLEELMARASDLGFDLSDAVRVSHDVP